MTQLVKTNIQKEFDLVSVANSLSLSPKTKEAYVMHMVSYEKYCQENNLEIGIDSAKDWISGSNTPSTHMARSSALKKVLSVIFKEHPGIIGLLNSIHELKPVKRDLSITESKYLTEEEVEKIISLSTKKVGLMIRTLFVTGYRVSEFINMRYDKCTSIRNGEVYEIKVVGKRSKEYTTWIGKELYDEIKEVFQGKIYLFENSGHPYTRQHITLMVKQAGKKIGKNISAHSLRHSRAEELMNKGVSIDKVSKFLNHSSVSTTANFYLHQKPSLEDLGVV